MKYVVYGLGTFAVSLGFMLLFFSIVTKPIKQEELSCAVGQAMQTAFTDAINTGKNDKECAEVFCELLANSLEDKGKLQIEIIELNVKRGIFRARIYLEFRHITGKYDRVEADRTLIYEGGMG